MFMRGGRWAVVAAVLAAGCNNAGGVNKNSNKPPVAHAGNDLTIGVNVNVAFDGSPSTDPDGTIVSYDWDFGDGSTHGTGATPHHVYASQGLYTVTLTVTDNDGATGTDSPSITVEVNAYDGTYTVTANPSSQPCVDGGGNPVNQAAFVATQVGVLATNGGNTLHSDWHLDSYPNTTVISYPTGPLTGNQFVNNWAYTTTSGGIATTYQNAWTGTFNGDGSLTSTLGVQESFTYVGLPFTCHLTWNVTGTYIGP